MKNHLITLGRSIALIGLLALQTTTLLSQPAWQQTTDYPLPGLQFDVVENAGWIYVLGGYNGTRLTNSYVAAVNPDGSLGAWRAATPLPQADQGPGVAVYNGWIYVALEMGGVYRAQLLPDGSLGAWVAEPSIGPGTSYRLGLRAYKGFLYVFGRFSNGFYNVVRIAAIHADGSLGAWATTTMPEARQHAAVHFYKDRVYLAGGITAGDTILDSAYSAAVNSDGTIGAWRQEASLPTPLWYHTTVRIDDQIYLLGGRSEYFGKGTSTIYRGKINADGTLSAWTIVDALPGDAFLGPGAVFSPWTGRVYVIGGTSSSSTTSSAKVWRKSFFDLTAGLVEHHPLDGNATNILGTGNNGVLSGVTPAADRFGNTVGSCVFDGNATIDFPAGPSVSPTGSVTYAFWLMSTYDGLYADSDPVAHPAVWWLDRTEETQPLFSLALRTSPVYGQFWFSPRCNASAWPTNTEALAGGQLTPHVWQHIAMVRDCGKYFRLYVDGTPVGASVYDDGSALTAPPIRMGRHAWNSEMGFSGRMDDLRIYGRALSATEVAALHSEGPAWLMSSLQPKVISAGGNATLSVTPVGLPPFSYQWFRNGNLLDGQTGPSLNLVEAQPSQAGTYSVVICNAYGCITNSADVSVFDIKRFAGLVVSGKVGSSFRIEYTASLGPDPTWQTLTNVTLLTSPSTFLDMDSPNYSTRFYRAVALP